MQRGNLIVLLAVTAVTALMAHSVATVASMEALPAAVGGAVIGALAFGAARVLRPAVASVEATQGGKRLLGLRIGTLGFCVAAFGWLLTVYLSPRIGFWFLVLGVATGFIGMAVHAVIMLRGNGA